MGGAVFPPWYFPGAKLWWKVGSLSLFQGIFPTQESNPDLPHCRWILYQLSHKGSPRILEGVAYPFSRGSCWPRNWTRISCIAGRFFTSWTTREKLEQAGIPFILLKQDFRIVLQSSYPWKDSFCMEKVWGVFSGEWNGSSLQYSCLENPRDRGAWRGTVHGVAKSWTRLSD